MEAHFVNSGRSKLRCARRSTGVLIESARSVVRSTIPIFRVTRITIIRVWPCSHPTLRVSAQIFQFSYKTLITRDSQRCRLVARRRHLSDSQLQAAVARRAESA